MKEKTALILEGGGFRGIFTAGILETFLKNQIYFDSVYGVSAGASYGASYISKQLDRNLKLNKFIGDKRYGGIKNLIQKGSLFSWEFIYGELAHNIIPYDYGTLRLSSDFFACVSNCNSGKAEFFRLNKLDKQDFSTLLMASGSLPLIAPIVSYKGENYLDGGLADSIPFEHALNQGAERVVVILTRPRGYEKSDLRFKRILKWTYRKYPEVYNMLESRARRYNESLKKLEELERIGKAFVIYPEQNLTVGRFEKDFRKTEKAYHEAMIYCEKIIPTLIKWFNSSR